MSKKNENILSDLSPDPRFVYRNNDGPLPSDVMIRKNRPTTKKRPSPLWIIVVIFLITGFGVYVIKNIMTVDQLAEEINEYHKIYNSIKNNNELIRAEINKQSSMERITKIAQRDLGMILPKEPPVWFEITEQNLQAVIEK